MRIIINIDVPELPAAIAFYAAAFGLRCSRMLDGDVAELTGAESCIYLLANRTGTAATQSGSDLRRYDRHWTPVHLDFVVDDLAASVKKAVDAGAKQESECIEWKGSRCISFSDPFGHGFCLIEFSDATYQDTPEESRK